MELSHRLIHIEKSAQKFRLGRITFIGQGQGSHGDGHKDRTRIVVHALDELAFGNTFGIEVHYEGIPVFTIQLFQGFRFRLHRLDRCTHKQVRKDFEAGLTTGIVFFPNENLALTVVTDYRSTFFRLFRFKKVLVELSKIVIAAARSFADEKLA